MKIEIVTILFVAIIFTGCNKEKFFDGPDFFQDDIESYSTLSDLLLPNDQYWSFTQLTRAENNITIDTTKVHSGNKSLKFVAKKSDNDGASKSSIAKQNMAFWDGETVRMSAWYFIEGTNALEWLFLMDLEEQAAIGAGPGMRLALVDNKLRVEYKFNEKEILSENIIVEPPQVKNEDPLTPLDQNFVTLNQLNQHYRLFLNRIQQQLATIGGGGETQLKYLDDIVGIAVAAEAV